MRPGIIKTKWQDEEQNEKKNTKIKYIKNSVLISLKVN